MTPKQKSITLATLGTALMAALLFAGAVSARRDNGAPLSTEAPAKPRSSSSPQGSPPMAVVPENLHNFGVMAAGESATHTFIVRNEGEGPLRLRTGRTTCKCTIANLDQDEIAPGASANVVLQWTPAKESEVFQQFATVLTNDPARPKLSFAVRGRVELLFVLTPFDEWWLGDMKPGETLEASGKLYSRVLSAINILSVESSHPLLTFETVPLSPEQLAEQDALCGHEIRVRLDSGFPVGPIEEQLIVSTDIGDQLMLPIRIAAVRPDAIRFLSANWTAQDRTAHLGIFKASEGKEERITLLVDRRELPGEFQIVEANTDDPHLKVEAIADESFAAAGKKKVDLVLTVPPGAPRREHRSANPVRVKLKTNNAKRREIEFAVAFVSY